jgi:hypothetical protein
MSMGEQMNRKAFLLVLAGLLAAACLSAQSGRAPGGPSTRQLSDALADQLGGGSGEAPLRGPGGGVLEQDSDGDGRPDYRLVYDAAGFLEREELDFNLDGKMDDVRFYRTGLPVREEIDSDFDGRTDIWVHIRDGSLVERWERDTDGDGVADVVKRFGG